VLADAVIVGVNGAHFVFSHTSYFDAVMKFLVHDSKGHLDYFNLSVTRCKHWEDTILANFVSRDGWVVSNAARGSRSWDETEGGGAPAASGGPFSFWTTRGGAGSQLGDSSSTTPGATRPSSGTTTTVTSSEGPSFPTTGGRALGSATRRGSGQVDPRQARLQAIEKRSAPAAGTENV
jgi:hypothetical protein